MVCSSLSNKTYTLESPQYCPKADYISKAFIYNQMDNSRFILTYH